MSDNEIEHQLLQGLRQLEMNLRLLHATHKARNLPLDAPYTINTENAMKLSYVNESLRGLKLANKTIKEGE